VEGRFGLPPVYNANRPETHDVFRDWRTIADGYCPSRLLLGETWVPDPERMASYYGRDDEPQLAFNFPFAFAEFGARAGLLRAHVSAHPRMTYRPESAIQSRPGWVGCRDGWVHKPPARMHGRAGGGGSVLQGGQGWRPAMMPALGRQSCGFCRTSPRRARRR
jgi:hypothetical protein